MTNASEPVVVLVTGPNESALIDLGRRLVEEGLIACINVVASVTSIYRWRGEVHQDPEALGVLKTTLGRADDVTRRVAELHPYDVPEILVLPVAAGSEAYVDWVRESVA